MSASSPSVAVVGAGLAGLAAAYRLTERGAAVTVFEAAAQPGGVVTTVAEQGFVADLGPNTVQERSPLPDLLGPLGLEDARMAPGPEAKTRYVVLDGRLAPLPTAPPGLLATPLLSLRAKLRLLREPFARPAAGEDESLAAFVRRRLGPEPLARAVDPFVGGIFAGDPERLSVRHAFPRLHRLEAAHGSLLRGMIHQARAARKEGRRAAPPPSISFRGGMHVLPDALARALGPRLRLNTPVASIRRGEERWEVSTQAGPTEPFDAVVVAVPAYRLPTLIDLPTTDRVVLRGVEYPPVAVLALGFRRSAVTHPLDGFGVLVPSRESFEILGALFSSTLFPDRAPEGHVLLTVFVGGARRPALAYRPVRWLVERARRDLALLLGVHEPPVWMRHRLWPQAIPQYALGYGRVLETLARLEQTQPGLHLAGSFRGGIAVPDALQSGLDAAERALRDGVARDA